ncbi:MAG: sulfotransferase [Desulfobulbaceae bacterium]
MPSSLPVTDMGLKRTLRRKSAGRASVQGIEEAIRLYGSGSHGKAENLCRKILKSQPRNGQALQILGLIALNRGDFATATKYLGKSAALLPEAAEIHCNLGIALRETGNLPEARSAFRRALRINSDLSPAHSNLALLELREGNIQAALTSLEHARRLRPADPALAQLHIDTLLTGRDVAGAIKACEQFVALRAASFRGKEGGKKLSREDLSFHARLANLYMRCGKKKEARTLADSVLRTDPHHPGAHLILATLERQSGNEEKAVERLRRFIEHRPEDPGTVGLLYELGKTLDRLGRYDDAFEAITRANTLVAGLESTAAIDRTSMVSLVRDCTALWKGRAENPPRLVAVDDTLPPPFFLVGFPRSGTTLTEKILRDRLALQSSDEVPVLHDMTRHLPHLLRRPFRYPLDLATLTEEEIHFLRRTYWEKMEQRLLLPKKGSGRFLDKLPLNLLHLQFVETIFPEARVIVALRDPRDVCLSNYMQNFGMNDAMIHFLDIIDTARFYGAVMEYWLACREKTRLAFLESRYEDLVFDPATSVDRLTCFLTGGPALPGSAEEQDKSGNDAHAFSTPSYFDVSRPIHDGAVARWQRYAAHLEETFPILAPYVAAFGYADH